MKILIKLVLVCAVISALYIITGFIKISYNISSKGIIIPLREWRIERLSGSILLSTEKDNMMNRISGFSVIEFQRGDHAEFLSGGMALSGNKINKGDTVGYIVSPEEERRLLVLNSQLEEQKRSLQVALTGEKEEQIKAAREGFILAEKEYETQRKLAARMKNLHESGVIADEAWEIAMNEYQVKKQNMHIARSVLDDIASGVKPEELELIRTNIKSLQKQVDQTKKRLDAFNITAPFSGTVISQLSSGINSELIIQLADMNELIIRIPVELYQLEYIRIGNEVRFGLNSGGQKYYANVAAIDNSVQHIDQKQHVFVSAILKNEPDIFFPNMRVKTDIICGQITVRDILKRMFKLISEN